CRQGGALRPLLPFPGPSGPAVAGRRGRRGQIVRRDREDLMTAMKLVVVGAGGRMGQALMRAVHESEGAEVTGALEREGSPLLGRDAGEPAGLGPLGVTITDDPLPLFAKADGVLDFSVPAASVLYAGYAAQARI